MDAKIDAYIALNPKHWRGIQAMTREHLERTLVALYVQRQEAHERTKRKLPNSVKTDQPAKTGDAHAVDKAS